MTNNENMNDENTSSEEIILEDIKMSPHVEMQDAVLEESDLDESDSEEMDLADSDEDDSDEDGEFEQSDAPVELKAKAKTETDKTFAMLGVDEAIAAPLAKSNITKPTPIQERAIPMGLEGRDVVGIAQTGTGKTLAYAIPMIQRLRDTNTKGLVLVPTRELALQVAETFDAISAMLPNPIRNAVLIGGASMSAQFQRLQRKPRVIIATPGRLADHMERRSVALNDVSVMVLDEADRMFDMGFAPQIKRVLEVTPKTRQTLLFSATMPPEIQTIADRHLNNPARIEVTPPGMSVKLIAQKVCYVTGEGKFDVLQKLLEGESGLTLVFAKTKHGVANLCKKIRNAGHRTEEIHSNRSMFQRKKALDGFKAGKFAVLVATDVAARGIDVDDVRLVVNFDLPQTPDDYVHRIGRTGRAGRTGTSVTFATMGESFKVKQIERLTKVEMEASEHSLAKPIGRSSEGGSRESFSRNNKRPQRSGERSGGGRSYGGDRNGGGRPSFGGGQRNDRGGDRRDDRQGDRPSYQSRSDRPAGDRPQGDRPYGDRNRSESFGNNTRSNESRPAYSRDDAPRAERQPSENGSAERSSSFQPRGPRGGNRDGSDSRGSFGGGRSFAGRSSAGGRSGGGRSNSDRNEANSGSYGGGRSDDRGSSFGGERSSSYRGNDSRPSGSFARPNRSDDRGPRTYNDRPSTDRPAGDRPAGDRPARTGGSSFGNRTGGGFKPRGDRPYGDRPAGGQSRGGSFRGNSTGGAPRGPRPEGRGPDSRRSESRPEVRE